jgi:formylglycine-generating enzyme required for sulfatase activity
VQLTALVFGLAAGFSTLAWGCSASSPERAAPPLGTGGAGGGGGTVTQPLPDASGPDAQADAAPEERIDAALRDVEDEADRAEGDAAEEAGPPPNTFENTLGMRFVPVAGTQVQFSIWETRVQDYAAYAAATGAAVPKPEFVETPLQPKASVSRKEAEDFAAWLTGKEQKEGKLGPAQKYRLPTNAEWDVAIQVGHSGGPYPWGSVFPPPDDFANYQISNDGFEFTSRVGSFRPNQLGLYDVTGNLWEWIGEGCATGGAYLVRGCGWNAKTPSYMVSAFQYCFQGDLVGHHNVGFRLVLEGDAP